MSQEPTRKSVRLRSASYRPRTTWRLPEIVSVRFSACETDTSLNLIYFLRVSLLHLLQVNIIVIKTLRLTFKKRRRPLQFLITR